MSAETGNGENLEITVQDYVRDWEGTPHVLVDCREPEEWDDGHIRHAVLIPLGDFAERSGELPSGEPVAVICRSGRRSLMAAEYLKDLGFARPVSVAGGMIAWTESGHPVVR